MQCDSTTKLPQFEDASIMHAPIDVSSRYAIGASALNEKDGAGASVSTDAQMHWMNCEGVAMFVDVDQFSHIRI